MVEKRWKRVGVVGERSRIVEARERIQVLLGIASWDKSTRRYAVAGRFRGIAATQYGICNLARRNNASSAVQALTLILTTHGGGLYVAHPEWDFVGNVGRNHF